MLRSLYSGISGMKVNQTKLDVIGNNIANVGTNSFKSQRARFSTALSQTITNASSPSTNAGGVNASQVGLGVQLASIDSVMTNGNLQSTGRLLDVAIDQTGYFVVSSGPVISDDAGIQVSHQSGNHSINQSSLSTSGSSLMYTRDGSFILDQQGNLLTTDGYRVMGYSLTNDDSSQEATSKSSNNVTAAGFTFVFGPGSQLNGYKVVLGSVTPGTSTSATVDKANKQIVVNGDFSTTSTVTTQALQTAISLGLNSSGISQTVSVTGSLRGYDKESLLTGKITGGSEASAPGAVTFGGFTATFDKGNAINGYSIEIVDISADTLSAEVDSTNKVIKVKGNFLSGSVSAAQVKQEINTKLTAEGVDQQIVDLGGSFSGVSNAQATLDTTTVGSTISIAGLTVKIETAGANTYDVVLGDVTQATPSATLNGNKLIINGNFANAGLIDTTALQTAINGAIGADTVSISGSSIAFQGLASDDIAGGTALQAPEDVSGLGLSFKFTNGGSLNGYTIEMGTVSRGTALSANIDTTKNKIVVSGDFVSGNLSSDDIKNAINNALSKKGLSQSISEVSGNLVTLSLSESSETSGGTPVQSIAEDGGIYFVDATATVNSYDGALKTLKIPETVKVPGTEQELSVVTYTIEKNGLISAVLEDGSIAALGQIAMATFKNQEGLTRMSGSLFTTSVNSGDPIIRAGVNTNGEDNSLGFGEMVQSYLEMSNVDLAEQFTEMITATRAFQASSKMISTGDEILQDIINLKR